MASTVVGIILLQAFELSETVTEAFSDEGSLSVIDFMGYVIFAPVVETLIMIPILKILRLMTSNAKAVILCSAVIWSLLHSLIYVYWGLFTLVGFLVFCRVYLNWEQVSKRDAFWMTAGTHSIHNLFACSLGVLVEVTS